MLERDYVSAADHVDYSVTEDASILRTETYQGLVNAIIYFVGERANSGTVRLYNYTGDVDADLARACDEVLHDDPLGAFAVQNIVYSFTRILTYYEVKLTIVYGRSAATMNAIREISGVTALRQELTQMVTEQNSQRILLVSYFSGDETLVGELLALARYGKPTLYHDPGDSFSCGISFYPETGSRRIIEIRVNQWGSAGSLTELTQYGQELEDTCDLLLAANPPAGSAYQPEELAAILRTAAGGYDYHGSQLALDALQGAPASETGYLLAMEALCQHCGIEVMPVISGTHIWLIVATGDGYRHLLPSSLYGEAPLALYTDQELLAVNPGLQWNPALYPACESRSESSEE